MVWALRVEARLEVYGVGFNPFYIVDLGQVYVGNVGTLLV